MIYKRFIKSKYPGTGDITESKTYPMEPVIDNPFRNRQSKPDEYAIEHHLGKDKFHFYQTIVKELQKIGEPELFWRGSENGWVLSIKEDQARSGSFILAKEIIIAQTWSSVISPIISISFKEIPVKSEQDILNSLNRLKKKMGILDI